MEGELLIGRALLGALDPPPAPPAPPTTATTATKEAIQADDGVGEGGGYDERKDAHSTGPGPSPGPGPGPHKTTNLHSDIDGGVADTRPADTGGGASGGVVATLWAAHLARREERKKAHYEALSVSPGGANEGSGGVEAGDGAWAADALRIIREDAMIREAAVTHLSHLSLSLSLSTSQPTLFSQSGGHLTTRAGGRGRGVGGGRSLPTSPARASPSAGPSAVDVGATMTPGRVPYKPR